MRSAYFALLVQSILLGSVSTYNIDTKFPIIFESDENDYFGFTVALLRNRGGEHTLVTAPRANSSLFHGIHQPGVLFSCRINFDKEKQDCKEVALYKTGNTYAANHDNNLSYMDKKDNMFLGISLDVQQNAKNNNNHIVTCGHLWKNQKYTQMYLVNGVCYVINSELDTNSVQKLVPLVHGSKQSIAHAGIYYYAYGQVGTSAAFSEDGKYLLLGAPGIYDWTGTILSYDATFNTFKNPVVPNPPIDQHLSPEPYIGYSVTSGKFFDERDIFIAVGAPRGKNSTGEVFIIKTLKSQTDKFSVFRKKTGTQFGEYFGASVLAVNLNNDQYTDLLVGAPFYSTKTGGDEGKVYVYISTGSGLVLNYELYGEKTPNSRFGSCIANLGDINQDDYNDIAIGAPYEDKKGAVYIYHGSSTGMDIINVQRIAASDISPSLLGFGISISRGLDIDNNYYPDILIGSYSSSQAVLLRTQPIIHLSPRLEVSPQQINTNDTACEFKGVNVSCLDVKMCLEYTGKHSPMNLDFDIELIMDYDLVSTSTQPRGFLVQNEKLVSRLQSNVHLEIGKSFCYPCKAHIEANVKDVITPVVFLFNYNLRKDSTSRKFCKNCPVVDKNSPNSIKKSVSFQTGCGKDNQCFSDLIVTASVQGNPRNGTLIIGRNMTLTLDIKVTNIGEPAYLSELFISLPSETPNINQDFCTVLTDQQKLEANASLQCDIGNPLHKGQTVSVQIKIDISKLLSETEKLTVTLEAKTASNETVPSNNVLKLPLFFQALADVGITGFAENEQIAFSGDEENKPTIITHNYFVMNHGPSPIEIIDIELYVPTSIERAGKLIELLTFTAIEPDSGLELTIPAKCNDSSLDLLPQIVTARKKDEIFGEGDLIEETPSNRMMRNVPLYNNNSVENDENTINAREKKSLHENTSSKRRDLIVDCKTARCTLIKCSASPFTDKRKFSRISLSMQLRSHAFEEYLDPWYRIKYITYGKIFVHGVGNSLQSEQTFPDEVPVVTILVRPGPPPSEEVEKWIIFVSAGVGILLLVIILFTLIKIGFFKRQQKEKMRQMLMQADLKELEYCSPEDRTDCDDYTGKTI